MSTGRIITFYSYKGGVGRTMVLANVARVLARPPGTTVLVIDLDLDAPGLDSFFPAPVTDPDSASSTETGPQRGVLGYLADLNGLVLSDQSFRTAMHGQDRVRILTTALPLSSYLSPTTSPRVTLLPAGVQDTNYAELLRSLDLVRLFNACPEAFEALRELLLQSYSFVLIDSRTGVSEVTGLTTALLADAIVAVFAPNHQNLAGVTSVLDQALAYQRRTSDPRELMVYPVPSRFDDSEMAELHSWRSQFRSEFQKLFERSYGLDECDLTRYFEQVMLRYVPRYSYGEPIVVDSPLYPGSLRGGIELLAEWIRENRIPWEA